MRRPSGTALVFGALGVLVAASMTLFLLSHERVEEEVEVGLRGLARVNDFFAAEQLLTRLKLETRSSLAMSELPPTDTALLWMTAPSQDPARSPALKAWVEEGGHLIWGWRPSFLHAGEELPLPDWLPRPKTPAQPWELFEGLPDWLRRPTLSPEDERPPFVRERLGAGKITVLRAPRRYSNTRLVLGGHAEELWAAVQTSPPAKAGLIIAWRDAPSIWSLIWRHAWGALVSLGVAGLVALWTASRRFGPLLLPLPRERRSLLEHVRASGRLLWQAGARESLFSATRDGLMRHLGAQHPELRSLEGEAWISMVLESTGANETLLRQAVRRPDRLDRRALLLAVRAAQEIRRTT